MKREDFDIKREGSLYVLIPHPEKWLILDKKENKLFISTFNGDEEEQTIRDYDGIEFKILGYLEEEPIKTDLDFLIEDVTYKKIQVDEESKKQFLEKLRGASI
jgi:hypothetical protein